MSKLVEESCQRAFPYSSVATIPAAEQAGRGPVHEVVGPQLQASERVERNSSRLLNRFDQIVIHRLTVGPRPAQRSRREPAEKVTLRRARSVRAWLLVG